MQALDGECWEHDRAGYWLGAFRARSLCGVAVLAVSLVLSGCGNETSDPAESAVTLPDTSAASSLPGSVAPSHVEVVDPRPVILFLGTSLTAGYGLPANQAYPSLIQEKLDSAGYDYRVVNAGVSGDTSAGGLRRLDWLLQLPLAVLVIELGANDMLRGLDIAALRGNLEAIIERTRAVHPEARFLVVGMRALGNLGAAYVEPFESVFPEVAAANGASFAPFLLKGVAGDRELNLADGLHPNATGQRIVADAIWKSLEQVVSD